MGEQFFNDFLEREESKLRLQEDEWPLDHELFWQRFENLKVWKRWQKKDGEDDKEVHHRNSTNNRMELRTKKRNTKRRHVSE